MTPRLRKQYDEEIRAKLTEQFKYANHMQVPMMTKIVVNMGVGEGVADRKKVETAAADLALIVGQKAIITKSRKAIANYKLRENQPIGCKVTLRKTRMYEFLDRLITIALPGFATSAASTPRASTAVAITASALRSTSCSPRSTTTKRPKSGAWTLPSARRREPTTRPARC